MPLPKLNSNSLFSNSVFIFLIRFFPSVANLLVLLYYSRHLDKATNGTYLNFWTHLYFIYPLACFGIHVLITTYTPGTILKLGKTVSLKQYLVYTGWLCLLSACFAWLQSDSLQGRWVIPFLFMVTFALGIIAESFLIVFKNLKSLFLINFGYAMGYLAIHKLVLVNGFTQYDIFFDLLVLNVIRLLASSAILAISTKRYKNEEVEEVRTGREIRTLWLHMAFYDIFQNVSSWIDKFIVSILLTATASAIYVYGTQNVPFLPLILSASGSAVLIQMNKVKAKDENTNLMQLMNHSARYLSNIVFPLMFFLMFFRYELFAVLLPGYKDAVPVFFVMLFILPFRTYSFITVFQKLHKGHLSTTGAVGELVLACLLMYPLYKWLGLPGLALSFIISSYTQFVYYFYHISRLLNTKAYNLVPVANWAVKLLIFIPLFAFLHYLVTSFFQTRVSLLLGIAAMVVTILVALFVEIRNGKNGNSAQQNEI